MLSPLRGPGGLVFVASLSFLTACPWWGTHYKDAMLVNRCDRPVEFRLVPPPIGRRNAEWRSPEQVDPRSSERAVNAFIDLLDDDHQVFRVQVAQGNRTTVIEIDETKEPIAVIADDEVCDQRG